MIKKYESVHFTHDEVLYVPCFQKNPGWENGIETKGYPTFEYRMEHATHDQQMAASMNPDYILILRGKFDAKTQPFDLEIVEHNWKQEL